MHQAPFFNRSLLACSALTMLLLPSWAMAQDNVIPEDAPWTDVWTMPLGGEDRRYVDYDSESFLAIDAADFVEPHFLDGKDVMLSAQFDRIADGVLYCFGIPPLRVPASNHLWDGIQFGDNLWILGHMTVTAGQPLRLDVKTVLQAPSDQTLLTRKLAAIPADDLQARIEFALWVRENGANQGNREVWLDASTQILESVVAAQAERAAEAKDPQQLLQAMRWAVQHLDNAELAARLADAPWFRQLPAQQRSYVEQYLHGLGFILRDGSWRRQSQALLQEFEHRFNTIAWHDANAFYQLAQWADEYGDVLEDAAELRHRALRAGLKADENHPAIRRALGLPVRSLDARMVTMTDAYADNDSGLLIPAPTDWKRHADPITGDASWSGEVSTSFISVTVRSGPEEAPSDLASWSLVAIAPLVHRSEYTPLPVPEGLDLPDNVHLHLCSFTEGQDLRIGLLGLVHLPQQDLGIEVWASGLFEHRQQLSETVLSFLRTVAETEADQEAQIDNKDAEKANSQASQQ